jgi:hypothetical protein
VFVFVKINYYVSIYLFIYLFIYTTTHCSLLRLIVRSGLDVPTFATTREHPAAEGGTLSEKCPVNFA